jgi:hypothetical protein
MATIGILELRSNVADLVKSIFIIMPASRFPIPPSLSISPPLSAWDAYQPRFTLASPLLTMLLCRAWWKTICLLNLNYDKFEDNKLFI